MAPRKKIQADPSEKKPTDGPSCPSGRMATRSSPYNSRRRRSNPKWHRKLRMGPPNKIRDSIEEEEKRVAAAGLIASVSKTPSTISVTEGPSSTSDLEPKWKRMRIMVPWQPGEVDDVPAAAGPSADAPAAGPSDAQGVHPVEVDPVYAQYLKEMEEKYSPTP